MNLHPPKDIQVTAAFAVACAAVALVPVMSAVRLSAGLLLALCLPGYALVRVLLGERSLGRIELAACVLGLSLVATILGGLLLNLAPGHLGRSAWAIFLAGLTLVSCAVASLQNPDERGRSPRGLVSRGAKIAVAERLPTLLIGIAAVIVVGTALAISVHTSTSDKPSLTLWLKPLAGHRVQVGVSPGAATRTGLVLVVHSGATQSRLAVPTLDVAHNYVETLTVPATAAQVVIDLDQGTQTLRHVQYLYAQTGSRQ